MTAVARIQEQEEPQFLTHAHMKRLLDVIRDPLDLLLVRLLCNGVPLEEVGSIRAKDFKPVRQVVKVRNDDGKRDAELDLVTSTLVKRYIEETHLDPLERLFRAKDRAILYRLAEYGEVAGVEVPVNPTTLRNTWLMMAVQAGRPLGYISGQLGFTRPDSTTRLVGRFRNIAAKGEAKILVYVPIHVGKEPYLADVIDAIAHLDYHNFDVLFGVNNSPPEFVEKVKTLAAPLGYEVVDLGVIDTKEEVVIEGKQYLVDVVEGGIISIARKARNAGLKHAREKKEYDYVYVLDGDSKTAPEAVRRMLPYFTDPRFKKVGIVGCLTLVAGSRRLIGGKEAFAPAIFFDPKTRENANECMEFVTQNWKNLEVAEVDAVGGGQTLISKDVFMRLDYEFSPDLVEFRGEDYLYCINAKKLGYKTICVCQILVEHLGAEDRPAEGEGSRVIAEAGVPPKVTAERTVDGAVPGSFYDETYYERGVTGGKSGYEGYGHDVRYARNFAQIAAELVRYFRPKRVLDVGCATGHVVKELVGRGVDAHGIDISEYAVTHAPADIRDRLVCGSATKLPWPDGYFDLVWTTDTLEHLTPEQARETIAEMGRVCSKNVCWSITSKEGELVHDESHINLISIAEWKKVVDEVTGKEFTRSPNNFLDQTVLQFQPPYCFISIRKKKTPAVDTALPPE